MPGCSTLQQCPVGSLSRMQCCHTCRNPLWHQVWSCSEEYSSKACSRDAFLSFRHMLVQNKKP